MKIYYDKDGWICGLYPAFIETDSAVGSLEVSDEYEEELTVTIEGYAWRVVDGQPKLDIYDEQKVLMVQYANELSELEAWFNEVYDMQVKQITRCERLGIAYDNKYGTPKELDEEALRKSARIKELRELLKE